jgi:hypothetical protein
MLCFYGCNTEDKYSKIDFINYSQIPYPDIEETKDAHVKDGKNLF